MGNNCVSLATAQRLKAAGFPNISCWIWVLIPKAAPWLTTRGDVGMRIKPGEEWELLPAPTAQEIADEIKEAIAINIYSDKRVSISCALKDNFIKSASKEINLAEALAELWLKLQEEK